MTQPILPAWNNAKRFAHAQPHRLGVFAAIALIGHAAHRLAGAPALHPPYRAGLHSRADTRNPNTVALSGTFEGRRYVIDAPTWHEAQMREINHVYWAATGQELDNVH